MTFMSNFRDSNESSPFQPHECLGIVGYHGQAFVRAHLTNVNNDRLHERIADLPNRIGHGNDLAAGLKLSIELLARKDRRFFRKIWLLTDGNTESKPAELLKLAGQAADNYINIYAIPVGPNYNGKLIESIVRRTHNGKYVSPVSFIQETDRLVKENYRHRANGQNHRHEAAIACLDLSANALRSSGRQRTIDTTVDFVRRLVDLKQRTHG